MELLFGEALSASEERISRQRRKGMKDPKEQWKREENRNNEWGSLVERAPNLIEKSQAESARMQDMRAGEILGAVENLTGALESVTAAVGKMDATAEKALESVTKAVNDMNESSGKMYKRMNIFTGVIAGAAILQLAVAIIVAVFKH